jgi:hypothetical protein
MDSGPHTVAIIDNLIPIVAIVFGIGIGMLGMYLNFRRKRELFQLYHAERMAALEKGMELPALPREFFQDSREREANPARHRRQGLILTLLGVGIGVGMAATEHAGRHDAWWCLVIIGLGVALLLSSYLEFKERAAEQPSDGNAPTH